MELQEQFGIDLVITDDFIDSLFENIDRISNGMRSLNNYVEEIIDDAEEAIIGNPNNHYKRLVLTRDTVDNSQEFDLS